MGISVGDSALKAMNLEIAKMATLAEAVVKIRALFKGEAVSFSEHDKAKLIADFYGFSVVEIWPVRDEVAA